MHQFGSALLPQGYRSTGCGVQLQQVTSSNLGEGKAISRWSRRSAYEKFPPNQRTSMGWNDAAIFLTAICGATYPLRTLTRLKCILKHLHAPLAKPPGFDAEFKICPRGPELELNGRFCSNSKAPSHFLLISRKNKWLEAQKRLMLHQPKASTWRRLAKQVGTNGIVPPECDRQNVGSNSFWACAAPSRWPFMGSLADRYETKPDDSDDISSGAPSNDFAAPFPLFFFFREFLTDSF